MKDHSAKTKMSRSILLSKQNVFERQRPDTARTLARSCQSTQPAITMDKAPDSFLNRCESADTGSMGLAEGDHMAEDDSGDEIPPLVTFSDKRAYKACRRNVDSSSGLKPLINEFSNALSLDEQSLMNSSPPPSRNRPGGTD